MTTRPSCRIIPRSSLAPQCSTALPSLKRTKCMWLVRTERPVGGPDTVRETYQEVQRQIKKGDVSKGEIKEPRKLAVFRFVNEQETIHGERPDWPILFDRWNEEYPEGHEWHYADASSFGSPKKPWDTFQRDYREARKVVMDPDHHFPARKVNTRLEEWQEEDLDRRRAAAKRDLGKIIARLEGETVDD